MGTAKAIVNTNYIQGTEPGVLEHIHQTELNIAIYQRETEQLSREVAKLLDQKLELRLSGSMDTILQVLESTIDADSYPLITRDIKELFEQFKDISKAVDFRLMLATVNNNMCRRFHTDVNDLRMLCTYSGPGTLWLTEDNINRKALDTTADNDRIVIDESKVMQVGTGDVVMLKGAIYPKDGTKAIVHRSPTIEESGERRLLLRFDTNEFLNFL